LRNYAGLNARVSKDGDVGAGGQYAEKMLGLQGLSYFSFLF
jgi:hypothetical protein